ncbi:MAG: ATP-binding cassette domain-containing protein [Magnetospirillum gryphiswaldense]|nr:ATP-binding cassette domain-containing protein [Magnetospirillum gryphiswaldense]
MIRFLHGLTSHPRLLAELLAASLLINLLGLAGTIFVMLVLGRYVPYGVTATLVTLSLGMVVALAAEFGLRLARQRLAAEALEQDAAKRAEAGFAAVLNVKAALFDRLPTGRRAEILRAVEMVDRTHTAANLTSLLDVPFAAITVLALLLISPALGTIALAFLSLSAVLTLAGEAWHRKRVALAQGGERQLRGLGDDANAVDTIRVFNAGPWLARRWQQARRELFRHGDDSASVQGVVSAASSLLTGAQTVAIIAYGAVLCVDGSLTTAQLIGANILAGRAMAPFLRLAQLAEPMARAAAALKLLAEAAQLPREQLNGNALTGFQGGLELQDVAFAHPGAVAPLAEHVTLSLPAGGALVVIGPSGSGKTVFARMLLALADPLRGRILVDGLELRQISHEWWRRQVCYVPQQPEFLEGSVADNLRLGRDLDDDTVYRAVAEAGLKPWLDTTSSGLLTMIEQGGRSLPAGLRHRLALARALAGGGRLCLFDDPSSGLDAEARQSLYETLRRLSAEGRTMVICSNDPAIARGASLLLDLGTKPVPRLAAKPQAPEADHA